MKVGGYPQIKIKKFRTKIIKFVFNVYYLEFEKHWHLQKGYYEFLTQFMNFGLFYGCNDAENRV